MRARERGISLRICWAPRLEGRFTPSIPSSYAHAERPTPSFGVGRFLLQEDVDRSMVTWDLREFREPPKGPESLLPPLGLAWTYPWTYVVAEADDSLESREATKRRHPAPLKGFAAICKGLQGL